MRHFTFIFQSHKLLKPNKKLKGRTNKLYHSLDAEKQISHKSFIFAINLANHTKTFSKEERNFSYQKVKEVGVVLPMVISNWIEFWIWCNMYKLPIQTFLSRNWKRRRWDLLRFFKILTKSGLFAWRLIKSYFVVSLQQLSIKLISFWYIQLG